MREITWHGNGVLPEALALARCDLPGGAFCLGDSANLTWVRDQAPYDAVLCGYLEPGFDPFMIDGWLGNWVA